jgi:hypothetical protein
MTLIEQYAAGTAAGSKGLPAPADASGGGATRSVRVCLGRRWISPELAGRLQAGSIVELDCAADTPAEVFADGRPSGKGLPVVVEGRLGIRMEKKE